jgi:SRSO17 transposase
MQSLAEFTRVFSDGTTQQRYIREVIFGKRRATQFWEITTDPKTLPKNSTWYVMTHAPAIKYHQVGNLYGLRNWVEYGLKQSKNELGWADFRVTDYAQIQKWWEVVMSAYLLVSLNSASLNPRTSFHGDAQPSFVVKKFPLMLGGMKELDGRIC